MRLIRAQEFAAESPWGALEIANMAGITTRLHWTDRPYRWHVSDGDEVFAVLDGRVEMRYREAGREERVVLELGDFLMRLRENRACRPSHRRSTGSGGGERVQRLNTARLEDTRSKA